MSELTPEERRAVGHKKSPIPIWTLDQITDKETVCTAKNEL